PGGYASSGPDGHGTRRDAHVPKHVRASSFSAGQYRSVEVRVVRLLDARDLEAGHRPEVALLGLVVRGALRRHVRRGRRVPQVVPEVLHLEPEVPGALVHELGEDLVRAGAGEFG